MRFWVLGFGVLGFVFGVLSLGFGVWGFGFKVEGAGSDAGCELGVEV